MDALRKVANMNIGLDDTASFGGLVCFGSCVHVGYGYFGIKLTVGPTTPRAASAPAATTWRCTPTTPAGA